MRIFPRGRKRLWVLALSTTAVFGALAHVALLTLLVPAALIALAGAVRDRKGPAEIAFCGLVLATLCGTGLMREKIFDAVLDMSEGANRIAESYSTFDRSDVLAGGTALIADLDTGRASVVPGSPALSRGPRFGNGILPYTARQVQEAFSRKIGRALAERGVSTFDPEGVGFVSGAVRNGWFYIRGESVKERGVFAALCVIGPDGDASSALLTRSGAIDSVAAGMGGRMSAACLRARASLRAGPPPA